jgi:TonB family protein
MANFPPSRPGPPPQGPPGKSREPRVGASLEHLAILLGQHGAGPASADIALDILLNEIVEQVSLATRATGAAIALARGTQYICRATTGRNAPDLGMALNTGAGLSGACIQTAEMQRCDDTERDSRVDAAACRELGVRSIVVAPLLKDGELLGVFEILSPLPRAFGDADIEALLTNCRRVIECVSPSEQSPEPAAPPTIPAREPEEAAEPVFSHPSFVEPALQLDEFPDGEDREPVPPIPFPAKFQPPRDYWTPVLAVALMVFTLLLGWLLGRVGKQPAQVATPVNSTPSTPATASAEANLSPQHVEAAAGPAKKNMDAKTPAQPQKAPAVAAVKSPESAGGLTVYENGKLVFKLTPAPRAHAPVEYASTRTSEPAQLTPPAALARLIQRVEPHYPDAARQQHIQGPVVLQTLVGKDGVVREMKALSGDSQLVMAAADAVRQWHFKPYLSQGSPVEFETEITVEFMLPE